MTDQPPISSEPPLPPPYTGYIGVPGEGIRFGIMSCTRCGAAVLIVPDEDNGGVHDAWHRTIGESP